MILVLIPLMIEVAQGQVTKTNLFKREEPKPLPAATPSGPTEKKSEPRPKPKIPAAPSEKGNLPRFYALREVALARFSENPVLLPTTLRKIQHKDFPFGSVIDAEILERIVAFPEAKVPVRAVIRKGPMKDTILLGEATLEKNSKRILIEFKKLREGKKTDVFQTTANALDTKGILGLEGEYHSGEAKYFGAEFLAAAAAGYADAAVDRSQNALGQVVEAATVANATKKAFSNALMRTADRFAEKVRSAPEFAIVRGPVSVQILIQEQPKLQE